MASSIYVIAAMCGCWYRESLVNPGVWESLIPCAWDYEYEYTSKGGYGLGQWTNVGTSDGRLYRLHQWVTANGYADGDGEGQLNYLTVEGYWNGAYNGTGDNAQSMGSYGSLNNFLNTTVTDLATLVWDFLANWEGVPGNAYEERLQWANTFLSYLQEHGGETATWTTGNTYLTEEQTKQNVLCVYNFFSGYTPEPPTGTYRITVTVSGNGTARASASYAEEGTEITLTATPSTGATFEGWTVVSGDVTITDNSFTMPANAVVIRATFSGGETPTPTEEHTLTVTIKGKAKATVTSTDDSGAEETVLEVDYDSTATSDAIKEDTELTLTIKPKRNFKVKKIEVTEGDITLTEVSKNKVYTFTFPDTDVTIEITIVKPSKWWMYMRPSYKWYS